MSELGEDVRSTWQRFLDTFEPLRPELYRYCRYLTHSPWEAEDLVQDTLARGFVTLGTRFHELANPRGWIFRVASNLWIDRMRRARRELPVEPAAPPVDARATREAAGTLLVQLSPQERAAVVLKDVFDLSLDEIAGALSTSVGAVKAALHRGRGKLVEPEREPARSPAPGVLDAFCAAFNAGDVAALTAMLLDSSVTEIVGVVTEYGRDEPADDKTGSFPGSLGAIVTTEAGGIADRYLTDYIPSPARCAIVPYRDEPILVFWYEHATGPAVRCVWTVETDGDAITRIRNYFFSPDVLEEVCRELALPFRLNGYRYW